MSWLLRTISSSIGMKYIMAISGLALIGFLLGHLTGNLLMFLGQDAFNTYAHNMQSLGGLLWVARLGLIGLVMLHVISAIRLTTMNRAARPHAYAKSNTIKASFSSRVMPMTGVIVLFYILYHLGHFTLHWINPENAGQLDGLGRHDAYRMVVLGFQMPFNVIVYVIGMLLIGSHLSHGFSSLFQSLGLNHKNFSPCIRQFAPFLAWVIALGFISIPAGVMLGIIAL